MKFKFGLGPSAVKAPLSLSNYLVPGIPYPAKVYREYKIPADLWGMYGNDTVGDCILAMFAHFLMLVTAHTGSMFIPDPQAVIAAYSAITGYDPSQTQPDGSNPTDTGTNIADLMSYMMTTGLQDHKILAWADIDYSSIIPQEQGVYIFGATLDAVQLPQSAMDQTSAGQAWSIVNPDGGILGGHGVPKFGYGAEGYTINTWARLQQVTWPWGLKYLMESAVPITKDWIDNADGLAPNMLKLDALVRDMKALAA